MLEKVLFTVDFSPFTENLLGCAEELASVGMREMVLLHVVDANPDAVHGDRPSPDASAPEKEAGAALDSLVDKMGMIPFLVRKVVKTGNPALQILETAKEENVSFIFMGAHGKGFLNRLILGSVSEKVLKLSDRPVMIQQCRVKGGAEDLVCENACSLLLQHILIANDFSSYAEKIEPVLKEFTSTFCAPVTLLHVQESGRSTYGWDANYRAEKKRTKERMRRMQDLASELEPSCGNVRVSFVKGSPGALIPRIADEINASLIIVGAFGNRTTGSLLGGVAEKVARESERPVLVLKA
ncbi:MAG: universal stress protein [Actinomycetota bacterium]|nr:universal stress protein [Actinomycetota bacterium]MDD5667350.1 universal stress protein [Actinomycetota bacterium]